MVKKSLILFTTALLSCLFLSACGKTKTPEETWMGIAPGMDDLSAVTDRTVYYDLAVESEPLFNNSFQDKNPQDENVRNVIAMGGTGYLSIGTQFLTGEPVQLWARASFKTSDIYLCRKDTEPELVLQDIPSSLVVSSPSCRWYLDRNGDFYCLRKINYVYSDMEMKNGHRGDASITKILSSGEILYETPLPADLDIDGICQPESGRVYVQLRDETDDSRTLREVDPATGKLLPDFQAELPYDSQTYLGSAGSSPAVTGVRPNFSRELTEIDPDNGSLKPLLYFTGTAYAWQSESQLQDFRVLENGSIQLLWTDFNGLYCFLEQLRMEKVEKIPIVCRGIFYTNSWFGERVSEFNLKNTEYHVVLEDCGTGNNIEDFARLTSVQMGAGKGPDILYGEFIEDYIDGMIAKGALEELTPYLEASGIREEDYFSPAFSTWRQDEQIYGVNYRLPLRYYLMDASVLGSLETPDIETLVDALLSQDRDGVWQKGMDSGQVLNWFLEGTDSLWGMVDWGNDAKDSSGSCNFNTPLFGKLLEAALRYGDNGRKNPEGSICEYMNLSNLFGYKGQAEREAAGKVLCGTLFDDGFHTVSSSRFTLAVNANSSHKKGAWELIRFLIEKKTQTTDFDSLVQPVHRNAFSEWLQKKIIYELATEHIKDGVLYSPAYYGEDISEEKQAEYRQAVEDARPLPLRTRPILTIIQEEAENYFNGSKSAEEVSKIVNNRVQLYLNERK